MHNYRVELRTKPRVLIMSHEPPIRSLLAEVLALEGYSSRRATNGEEGLRLLQQTTDSCIVFLQLDPYQDMWQLMQMLHEHPLLHDHHRIIQVDIAYHLERAHLLKPDDVLVMPFTDAQVAQVMARNWAILRHSQTT